MKKYFVLMCLLLCGIILFTACTKYEPTPPDDKMTKNEDEKSTLEKPIDFENWPAERKILFEIANATMISFSETLPQKMDWRFEQNEKSQFLTFDAYMMVAEATEKNSELINKYLESQGFIFDNYNVADGPMGGQVGYQKEKSVCTIHSSLSLSQKGTINNRLSDITVRCGELNKE